MEEIPDAGRESCHAHADLACRAQRAAVADIETITFFKIFFCSTTSRSARGKSNGPRLVNQINAIRKGAHADRASASSMIAWMKASELDLTSTAISAPLSCQGLRPQKNESEDHYRFDTSARCRELLHPIARFPAALLADIIRVSKAGVSPDHVPIS
jgi:hypothetical protein